jgi:hypothetical protein
VGACPTKVESEKRTRFGGGGGREKGGGDRQRNPALALLTLPPSTTKPASVKRHNEQVILSMDAANKGRITQVSKLHTVLAGGERGGGGGCGDEKGGRVSVLPKEPTPLKAIIQKHGGHGNAVEH